MESPMLVAVEPANVCSTTLQQNWNSKPTRGVHIGACDIHRFCFVHEHKETTIRQTAVMSNRWSSPLGTLMLFPTSPPKTIITVPFRACNNKCQQHCSSFVSDFQRDG